MHRSLYGTLLIGFTLQLLMFAMPHKLSAHNSSIEYTLDVQPDSLSFLPPNFSIGLDIERLKFLDTKSTAADQTYYFPDTVVVLSTDFQPKRYIFTYNSTGYQLSRLIQELQNSIWTNSSYDIRTFDNNGNILTNQVMSWINGSWSNETKLTFTYTSNNLVLTSLSEQWLNSQWVGTTRETFTYDVFGNNVAHLTEKNISGSWQNNSYSIFTYDAFNNRINGIRQVWNINTWTNQQHYIYAYNQNQGMIYSRIENWIENDWVNLFEEDYTYNGSGYVVGYTGRIWVENNWENYEKYTYEYNNLDYLINATGEIWTGSGWEYAERGQYDHNAFGGRQNSLIQKWFSNDWTNISLLVNAYDNNGNTLTSDFYAWDGETWVQNSSGLLEMFYSNSLFSMFYVGYRAEASYTSIEVGQKEFLPPVNHAKCYPNPIVDKSILTFNLSADDLVRIDIITSSGMLVSSIANRLTKGHHQIELNLSESPSGVYIINIESSTLNQVIKSIKK